MSTEIANQNTGTVAIERGYSSIQGDDVATRKKVYAAVSDYKPFDDILDKEIVVADVLIQHVPETEKTDPVTGQVVVNAAYMRTILIDDKGVAYGGGSDGVITSLRNVFDIMGQPGTAAWPLKMKLVQKKSRSSTFKFYSIELV